ncbi:hypothetical protein BB8028_0009g00710 [Beauveria bassiana]|uniref:HNH nuclease domain-containing protein n=1 Tax=Beauveria bassiana TaxID=176275 RepID=A0A2S7YPG1_BEABA|nr:hypothetical protein BB8028_0009g00710 [Beauveria bassiana]
MAEEEGSSSVVAGGPYSRAAYVEAPAIPDYHTLHEKTPAVQQIRTIYDQQSWEFTYWHLALFYMLSEEDLAELISNPEQARKYGDAARLFGTLFTSGRIPSAYKLPGTPNPPTSAPVNLAPVSASMPWDAPGSSKTRDADEGTRGSLKRKFSVRMATGSLKAKVTKLVKRAEIFPAWRQPSSSGADFSLDMATQTETEPSALAAPLDKGKRPMTRSASAAAARVSRDTNESDSAQSAETARRQGSQGQLAATMQSSSVVQSATHARRRLGSAVERRDREECVVTHKSMAFDGAHIVPFSVNSTRARLDYVPPALDIAERLLGVPFRQRVQAQVENLGGTDFPWNVITLTPYLHRLWDHHGVVGFRPRYIDSERGKSGKVIYFATFTFHWLPKNALDPHDNVPLQLSADDCLQMVSESVFFSVRKDRLFETVYTPGRQPPNDLQRLEDGHVCRVRFTERPKAESMMRMLDLRWQASRLLCLSGGAGEGFLEPASDVDSDSDAKTVSQGITELSSIEAAFHQLTLEPGDNEQQL